MRVLEWEGLKTLVFRVRLCTSPLRSTRSKAKLPSWLTGEKVSRLRCPLRTPEELLGKVAADGGANTEVGCLVFIGRGLALGAVNKLLGFAGDTSVMSDVPNTTQTTQARCGTEALLADKLAWGLRSRMENGEWRMELLKLEDW